MSQNSPDNLIKAEDKFALWYAVGLVTKLGISIFLIVVIFLLTGRWLDARFQTGWKLSALMALLSLPMVAYNIYWLLEPIIGSEKRKKFLRVRNQEAE